MPLAGSAVSDTEDELLDRLSAAAERRERAEDELAQARDDSHAALLAVLRYYLSIGKNNIGAVARRARYDREHVRRIREKAGLTPPGPPA